MEAKQRGAYYGMLALSIAFTILAVVTMLPNSGASKPNVLGYRSVCSFAPAASALCALLAGLTCTLRNRVVSSRAASMRYRPLIVPVAVTVVLLAVAAFFGVRFENIQARFGSVIAKTAVGASPFASLADGTRRAVASEGDIAAAVELTVTGGRIESLTLTDATNVERSVAEQIFGAVRTAQSSTVNTVSGATASSKVLLKAIESAMNASP